MAPEHIEGREADARSDMKANSGLVWPGALRRIARTLASLFLGVGLIAQQARAQEAARPQSVVDTSKAGMDPERLARITARMKEFVLFCGYSNRFSGVARAVELESLDLKPVRCRLPRSFRAQFHGLPSGTNQQIIGQS